MMYEKKYKVLMLTTSMQYGGAETHIIELARYLQANGCEVKVISNAGAQDLFALEFEKIGVGHIFAPFGSRNIISLLKSGRILKKALKNFKPDIVHAHARIPAFVASGICRRSKTPLVTTMHGTFKNTPLLRLLTSWGDYSLYVSGDIKEYWAEETYKIKRAGYMAQTINGINTDLFNPQAPGDDIREEFKINPGEKIILTVSRLDSESSFSALKLCEIAGQIYGQDKDTRIIIVGDGEIFADIQAKARAVNEKLGLEYIIMAGRRADTYKFYAACSVFAGISRSALEAAACDKPVIMCGDYGWAGRLTQDNAGRCEATNFTCRGFGYPDNINGALLGEILFCLGGGCEFGAELVQAKYSIKKMADDAYATYQKAELRYKNYDFVLGGYYGSNNIGDDALLLIILSNILKLRHNLKICVLTKSPRKMQQKLDNYFANIVAKPRFNPLSVISAVKKSRALVFGGGTLLQDHTSSRSLRYYIWLINTARRHKKKAVLYANGVGPLYGAANRARVKKAAEYISLATIRDEESYRYMLKLGMDGSKVHLTADEAVMIRDFAGDTHDLIKGRYVAVSVRRWQGLGAEFFGKFAAAVDAICREHDLVPVYIIMRPEDDRAISQKLAAISARAYIADTGGDIGRTLAVMRSAEAVIAMRLHALIFASAFDVPMIGVSYDPKVRGFLEMIYGHNNYTLELDELDKDILVEKFRVLLSNRESLTREIGESAQAVRFLAEQNARLFLEELDK